MTLKKCAASISFESGAEIPSVMFVHTIGRLIRKPGKDGTFFEDIKTRAAIIKDATGVALTMCRTGAKNVFSGLKIEVKMPSRLPAQSPVSHPTITRKRDLPQDV